MGLRLRFAAAAVVLFGAIAVPGSAWAACPAQWTIIPSPSPGDPSLLTSVAAGRERNVWAVGSYDFRRSLAIRWDGERWKNVALTNPFDEDELNTVAHIPRSDRFIAAGRHGGEKIPTQTFILKGVHGEWRYSPRSDRPGNLYGAAARNSKDAWLVGHRSLHGAGPHPTALHRTGDRWRRVDVPQAKSGGFLTDVDAVPRARQAWAVGTTTGGFPYTFRWRNGAWEDVQNTFANVYTLNAVEAVAWNNVWVAGWRLVGAIDAETFIAHWNGSGWKVSPTGTGHPGVVESLAAVDAKDIWAVGDIWAGDSDFLHWDGSTWQEVPVTIPGGGSLNDISTVPGSRTLWAVGKRSGGRTLTMRLCGS